MRMKHNFFYESVGEIILKIGPHLPKFLSNIRWLSLLSDAVELASIYSQSNDPGLLEEGE